MDQILAKLFSDPESIYGLKEFSNIDISEVIKIFEEEKGRFYLKDLKTNLKKFIFDSEKQIGKPEEIIRQLWLYKLHSQYGYPFDRIDTEKSVNFGQNVYARTDIIVYKKDKLTPYIIVEVKNPTEKKGVDQLKCYLSAEGCEIGVWSNGNEKVILYRPHPKEYQDSLSDIPKVDQTIDDLFEIKKSWQDLNPHFDFIHVINRVQELALAGSGADVFEEIFKLIYAKLYDEKQARERRENQEVIFRKYQDSQKTYDVINNLFKRAISEWPGTFEPTDKIKISADRLNVCVPFLENIRLFDTGPAEYEIIDNTFEYLITEVAKGSKGQYFTPRFVIKMCVEMLNPQPEENIIDPACGSGGFLLHSMYYVWDNYLKIPEAKKEYASKHLFGLDFDDNMRRISQALMLMAGDGKHHIFKRNSLDARDWQLDEAEDARSSLRPLLTPFENLSDDKENKATFRFLNFDLLLTNPPFAGENPEQGLLRQYELAKNNGKLKNNVERHILFIERSLNVLRSGGRMAIVLPQGVLNNTNMEYVRQFLFDKARILAVVGLPVNTFKPHTGTKTSVLFLQKWGNEAGKPLPDYPIFMAVSKKSGKNNSGEYVYKKDTDNNFLHDENGRKILDHDLDEITKEFIRFAREQRFGFWN